MQNIWIVENDEDTRDLVSYALASAGFKPLTLDSAESLRAALPGGTPDLLILDLLLPDADGIALLKELEQPGGNNRFPVILVSAKAAEYDRILGLDLGADDFMAKPFSVMELVARVRAVLRRASKNADKPKDIIAGSITINLEKRSVKAGGQSVTLTYKEFELLYCLWQNRGRVMTRDNIMSLIWGYGYEGESRTVDVHIKSLRQKLGEAGNIIGTVRGVGYILETDD